VGRSTTETQLSGESLGWMLPLSVFCPVYRWDQGLPLWWYSQFWKFIMPAAYFCEFQSQKFRSLYCEGQCLLQVTPNFNTGSNW
jgi:hypothetical protein